MITSAIKWTRFPFLIKNVFFIFPDIIGSQHMYFFFSHVFPSGGFCVFPSGGVSLLEISSPEQFLQRPGQRFVWAQRPCGEGTTLMVSRHKRDVSFLRRMFISFYSQIKVLQICSVAQKSTSTFQFTCLCPLFSILLLAWHWEDDGQFCPFFLPQGRVHLYDKNLCCSRGDFRHCPDCDAGRASMHCGIPPWNK